MLSSKEDQWPNYFAPNRWNKLPKAEKDKHTLGMCKEYALTNKLE